MKRSLILLFVCSLSWSALAQKSVVIPFLKKGEVVTAIIDDNPCYRSIEAKVKEIALTKGDLQLINYKTLINKIGKDRLREIKEKNDLIKLLIQEAEPDIYIIADVVNFSGRNSRTGKTEHALYINLTAHQSHTGRTIAAATLDSGRRFYDNCQDLMHQAFFTRDEEGGRKIDLFVGQLLVKPESTVSINFSLDKNAEGSYMDKLSNGMRLAKEIDAFIKKIRPDKDVQPKGTGANIIKYDEVFLPVKKENYGAQDLMYEILDHLEQLSFEEGEKLRFKPDQVGNTITFTLQ